MSLTPTPAELATARTRLAAIDRTRRRVAQLTRSIAAAEAAEKAAFRACTDKLLIKGLPDRLAGLAPWFQRTDPATRRRILSVYREMLDEMHDGNRTFGTRPLRIDFAALAIEARPYLAAPFAQLAVNGVYPALDLARSNPAAGTLVYVSSSGAIDAALWQARLTQISEWLSPGARESWQLTASTVTSVTLTRRAALPPSIPFTPAYIKPDHLFLGLNVATQRPHHVAFADLSHFLITGTVGMGKSISLASTMKSLLASQASIHHIYCVDPGGIAFGRYRGASPKLTTLSKPEDFMRLAADLVALMDKREAELGASGREKFLRDWVFVVVDEWPAYGTPDGTDKASKEAHAQFAKHMLALAKRGRKSAIRLVLCTQVPSEQDIWPALRAALPGVLAFRTPLIAHANSLFGELSGLPADPRTLARGRALYRDGTSGELVHVQFPLITAPAQQESIRRARP